MEKGRCVNAFTSYTFYLNVKYSNVCREMWLEDENNGQEILIDHLTQTFEESEAKKGEEEEDSGAADQLSQLVHTFCQGALVERTEDSDNDELYLSYADILAR